VSNRGGADIFKMPLDHDRKLDLVAVDFSDFCFHYMSITNHAVASYSCDLILKIIWHLVAKELADRLNRHGLHETETSITGKLARGTFAASFFLACIAVLELEGIALTDL
jgi:hypothetical protein